MDAQHATGTSPGTHVVIIGGGQGGLQLATSLREEGFGGSIDIVSDESELPYHRPPLSKDYLTDGGAHRLHLRDEAYLDAHSIRMHLGKSATAIDRWSSRIELNTGEGLPYDSLVLATGARPTFPSIPGNDLEGVVSLRTRQDADALSSRLGEASRVATIGGGLIGLEVASTLRAAGHLVTVVERNTRLMSRSCSSPVAEFMLKQHQRMGTTISLNASVSSLAGQEGAVRRVSLADQEEIEADVVLLSTGVIPNIDLASQAGLAVGNGVVVDATLTTSDPQIRALGDCAEFPSVHLGTKVRLESVQNAIDQARHIAHDIATGKRTSYERTPWFWSNQCGHRIQMVGLAGHNAEVRIAGDTSAGKFSAFLFDDGLLARVESVNDARTHLAARKLFDARAAIHLEAVLDAKLDLKSLLTAAV